MLQGPIVYGYKAEDRLRVSENLKLAVATATMMNKPDGKGMPKEQGWAHSLEASGRTGEYNKIGVSMTTFLHCIQKRVAQLCPWASQCEQK